MTSLNSCSICLDPIPKEQEFFAHDDGDGKKHPFHSHCLSSLCQDLEFARKKFSCPICATQVPPPEFCVNALRPKKIILSVVEGNTTVLKSNLEKGPLDQESFDIAFQKALKLDLAALKVLLNYGTPSPRQRDLAVWFISTIGDTEILDQLLALGPISPQNVANSIEVALRYNKTDYANRLKKIL